MTEFRNEPWRGIYQALTVASILVRIPYWILVGLVPAWRPRRSWNVKRTLENRVGAVAVRLLYRTNFGLMLVNPEEQAKHADQNGFVWVDGVPDDFVRSEIAHYARVNDVSPARVSGYWYGKQGEDGKQGQPAAPGEKVMYWLYGGGHIMGCASPAHTRLLYPHILQTGEGRFTRLFALDWRKAAAAPFPPANPFPAALLDCVAGYRYLVHTLGFAPENIILGGDSSGGHLAVMLAHYLATEDLPGLALPRGILLHSPTLDWGCTHDTGPACAMARNAASDAVAPVLQSGYTARALLGKLPPGDIYTNAWLSPSSLEIEQPAGWYVGFPPTAILAGEAEQTLDPMRTARDRLVQDIGEDKVRYLEYTDASHDFLGGGWEPEVSMGIADIRKWYEDQILRVVIALEHGRMISFAQRTKTAGIQ